MTVPLSFPKAPRLQPGAWSLGVSAALLLGVIALLSVLAFSNFNRLESANERHVHTYRVLAQIARVEQSLDGAEKHLRGWALTGQPRFLEFAAIERLRGTSSLQILTDLTSDNALQQKRLRELTPQVRRWHSRYLAPYEASSTSDVGRVNLETTTRRAVLESLKEELHQLERTEQLLLEQRVWSQLQVRRQTMRTLGWGCGFAFLLGCAFLFSLERGARANRRFAREMQNANVHLQQQIDERRGAEARLRASEEVFRNLAEDSLDLICRHAPDGSYLYASRATTPILGCEPADLVGKLPFDFFHPDDRALVDANFQRTLAGEIAPVSYRFRRADGSYVWLETILHAVRDADDEVREWHTTSRDISARRLDEQRRQQMTDGLHAVVEATDELLGTPDQTTLLRRAVELGREKLGLERCEIWLASLDETRLCGTFGTDLSGQTVDERLCIFAPPGGWRHAELLPPSGERFVLRFDEPLGEWHDGVFHSSTKGWNSSTLLMAGGEPIGVFCCDAALTGAAPDAVKQELTSVYCSILGALLERERTQQNLLQNQNLLQTVVERAPIFLYSVDKNERFTLFTGQAMSSIGLDHEKTLGRRVTDLAPGTSASVVGIRRTLTGETTREVIEFGGRRLDMWRQPIHDSDGQISAMIGVGVDITERVEAENALYENEKRYREVVDSLQEVVFQTDARGRWTFLNPAWSENFGWNMDESLGRHSLDFVHSDERETNRARFQTLARGEKDDTRFVLRLLAKSGEIRFAEVFARAIRRDGKFIGVSGALNDVTERTRAENALRDTLELQRAIVDSASYGLIATDASCVVRVLNPAAEAMVGHRAADVVGLETPVLWHDFAEIEARAAVMSEELGESIDAGFDAFTTLARRGVVDENNWTIHRPDGTSLPVRLAVTALRDSENQVSGYLGIAYDLTETLRTERLKSEFVSVVSHELRTPLTAIRGAIGLIQGGAAGELPARARSMIDIAHKNAERLVILINDILDIEKIESGKMRFEMKPISLGSLLQNALESNAPYAQTLGVEIELEPLAPELQNVQLCADEHRLQQVLANLLSNACKFTPEKGMVRLRARVDESRVRVEVEDAGSGVPAEFVPRLFERFAQADSSATRKQGGTGLGLAISRAIIEKHDGHIDYAPPDSNHGSLFYFELDLLDAPEDEDARSERPRVLVCEDNADVASAMKLLFIQSGYEATIAPDLATARAHLREKEFDALTLDVMLPDGNGLDLLAELRSDARHGDLPVVVVSAICEDGQLRGKAFGAADWLQKPVDSERLLDAVARVQNSANNAGDANTPCLLHVEDDADLREVMRLLLGDAARIVSANSLAQAREKIAAQKFDLALLDLGLPDGCGLELLPLLAEQNPPVPVVIFSAREVEGEDARGVAAALTKSRTGNADLRETIEKFLKKRLDWLM